MKVNMEKIMRHPNAEFIIAFAEGKQLQFLDTGNGEYAQWTDFQGPHDCRPNDWPWIAAALTKWRIKPEQQWVRVGVMKAGLSSEPPIITAISENLEKSYETSPCFSHWLSDRLYYTPKDKA